MILYIMLCIGVVLGIGLLLKWFLDTNPPANANSITWREYAWSSVIISCVVVPLVIGVSWHISKKNQMIYVEHLNGWEVSTVKSPTHCTRDGSCRHTYSCDPYVVPVTYSYQCGKSRCTGVRMEIRYHSCPYAKTEWTHTVHTTLGDVQMSDRNLPDDYATNPWRPGRIASPRPSQVGDPAFWTQAKNRIASGNPGPVTMTHAYENYVLASHHTILKTSVYNDIERYRKDSLLPYIERPFHDFYLVDKIYPVKIRLPGSFYDQAAKAAAVLGTHFKGDLRIVFVPAAIIQSPDNYTRALQAYWQSRSMQQSNHALPKNSVVVVLGVSTERVMWSRAFTGMPTGNEALIASLSTRLTNTPLTSDSLFGRLHPLPRSRIPDDTLGAVVRLLTTGASTYKRENMKVYHYLRGDIKPSDEAKVWSAIASVVLGSLFWLIPFAAHCPTQTKNIFPRRTSPYFRR